MRMIRMKSTRRAALNGLRLWAARLPLLQAQSGAPRLEGEPIGRITPREDAVNVFEVEAVAERKLSPSVYSTIAGSDRRAFDHMLVRPRRFVNVEHLDLTCELFGEQMFTPILVGPASNQQNFDPEGEIATVRGAAKAQVAVVISRLSSQPIEKIAAEAKTPLWYQIYLETDMAPVLNDVRRAVKAGCKVVCITVGAFPTAAQPTARAALNWNVVDQVRRAASVPIILKGIMNPQEAREAVDKGVQGIIVSNQGGGAAPGLAAPMEVLAPVVDAVGGKVPVLIDGSFRRGTDIVKGLALGARAVLVTRPVLWGLAAYGSDGVDTVLKMLQSETARTMGNCCRVNLAALDRSLVRIVKF
jgi:4-hydroxymandelate oxidase